MSPDIKKRFVVAGIGTEIGKTFVSAVLTEALEADYWKPVQAGNMNATDTDFIRQHVSNNITACHPEGYRLCRPMSPHAAAEAEGIRIELDKLSLPGTGNVLIIELAGGLMVPLNDRQLNIDLLRKWNLPVILVSQNYLGSINHTLLSAEVLKQLGVPVAGLIFNGDANPVTEEFILNYTRLPCLARIGHQKEITKETVRHLANALKPALKFIL
jgi:dethiobiotin synthetase